jgi:hypothetical protein
MHHVLLGGLAVALAEFLVIARGVHQRPPLLIVTRSGVQHQLQIDINETRDVFRALDVTTHPVNGISNAA